MSTPSAVGVDDDLSAGKTSISLGTTDDEESRGLDLSRVNNEGLSEGLGDSRGRWSQRRGIWRG